MADIPITGDHSSLCSPLNWPERARTGFTHLVEFDYEFLNQVTGSAGDAVYFTVMDTGPNFLITRCAFVQDEVFATSGGLVVRAYTPIDYFFTTTQANTTGPKSAATYGWIPQSAASYGADSQAVAITFKATTVAPGSYPSGKMRFYINIVSGRY